MSAQPVRILLVDDHKLVRLGLASLLGTVSHFVVVGEAGGAGEAVKLARLLEPDVIIMDVRLLDGSGVDACREIRAERPATRVVMLTSFNDDEAVLASVIAGASGYLLKHGEPEEIIRAVELATRGGQLLDPAAIEAVLSWVRQVGNSPATNPLGSLTEPELRILRLIAAGKTNHEIAHELFFSAHTVKVYVSYILRKLQVSRRAEAAALLARQGRPLAS